MRSAALALPALSLAVLALPGATRAAQDPSIACEGGIVSVGDTKLDLLGKCGPPTLRDVREDVRASWTAVQGGSSGRRITAAVEQWTYDFGPQRFTHVVTLEGAKVAGIERGSYGYLASQARPPGIPVARCDSSALREGDGKLDLLARCGEPALRDHRLDERAAVVAAPDGRFVQVTRGVEVEIWTYNFGPDRFLHLVTLEDGKVVRVERGSYGYRP